jgi:hypothetical protein
MLRRIVALTFRAGGASNRRFISTVAQTAAPPSQDEQIRIVDAKLERILQRSHALTDALFDAMDEGGATEKTACRHGGSLFLLSEAFAVWLNACKISTYLFYVGMPVVQQHKVISDVEDVLPRALSVKFSAKCSNVPWISEIEREIDSLDTECEKLENAAKIVCDLD